MSKSSIIRGAALLVFAAGLLSSDVVAEEPSAAVAMLQAARASGLPVGLVLRDGNDLCSRPGVLRGTQADSPLQRLRMLADAYGYRVDASGPVVLVTPNEGGPYRFEQALQHRWPAFPAEDSVMHTMGMILNGWMKIERGANGFGISSGSSPEDPILHLPAGKNETSQEIANRIVSLGHKGVWVAWQMPRAHDGTPGEVRLATLSYLKYDDINLDQFRCAQVGQSTPSSGG